MSNTVSAEWLRERLRDPDLAIADCRFVLGDPAAGKLSYENGHLPGAVYFDLERDLSGPIGIHGGRHPLPEAERLAAKLGAAGIGGASTVVAYDDQGGAMASRLWWILNYYGHTQVYVLDGGYGGWIRRGYPLETEVRSRPAETFVPRLRHNWLVDAAQVRRRLGDEAAILVDSRDARRYLGIEEPIDKAAGHIPGAVHYDWKSVFTAEGALREPAELQEHFRALDPAKEIVVYCGSGVTACANVLALTEAGYANVKLYGGSWSDWITYPDHPIETQPESNS
ncbi:sulfurtransferase [Paenibacillus sp. GYB003]|uniref:sulfurtransferase n=1 Tax=Paenibacillus sp. GYB003 TaxID=2994392 RepID=UPI002F961C43